MSNHHLRGAIATFASAAICSSLFLGLPTPSSALASTSAIIATPAHGYSGLTAFIASGTGSFVAPSPSAHSTQTATASSKSAGVAGSDTDSEGFGTMSERSLSPLGLMSTADLQLRSLNALYQLARLTTPAQPHLDVTLFGGGLASQDYYLTDEGIQLEQSVTEGLGIVGRVTGYQLWIEKNSTSPLAPSNQTVNRLNFGRFQAGFDLSPLEGFNFVFLGGHDVGDSDAWTVESDISMWFMLNSAHPFNVFIAPVHNFQNDVTSSEIDLRVVAMQTPDWILLLGAGGSVYGGGFIDGLEGQGGPIVGIYNRIYQLGADLQFGGGSPGVYGELTIYKLFSVPGL